MTPWEAPAMILIGQCDCASARRAGIALTPYKHRPRSAAGDAQPFIPLA